MWQVEVIQIDEAALQEGLPLHKSEQADYQNWAVHGFRITTSGVKDTTQVCNSLHKPHNLKTGRASIEILWSVIESTIFHVNVQNHTKLGFLVADSHPHVLLKFQ
jgi:methionine synthase II (cobalamin-independent)